MRNEYGQDNVASIAYSLWLQRVVGWDAVLPCFVTLGSVLLLNAFQHRSPADIFALAGLPVAGFLVRWCFGYHHIRSNTCGRILRAFQIFALFVGLIPLVVVDFLTALSVFADGKEPPEGVAIVHVSAYLVYLTLAAFAMYPGRVREHARFRRTDFFGLRLKS